MARSLAEAERVCFCFLSESNGRNLGNSGLNTSHSPGVTPARAALLHRSVEPAWLAANGLAIDGVGSNGRSTGCAQQISQDVGGTWGSMVETLRPADAARMFLERLVVTGDTVYAGWNVTQDGSKEWVEVPGLDPIAVDVLRVQQPLASEVVSGNYMDSQVAAARLIAAQYYSVDTGKSAPAEWWALRMHWKKD